MSALPKGWAEVTIEELGGWRGGGTPSKARDNFWKNGTIPWVSPKDMKRDLIDDAEDHITEAAVRGSATNLIPPRSVLVVTRSGILRHSLPIAINTREVAINQDLKALTPHNGIDAEFVAGQFRADAQGILADCAKSGTTVDSVDFTRLRRRGFRLAPFAEQRRIVAKLDALLDHTARARADLDWIPNLIAHYKKTLLTSAFNGKLVDGDDTTEFQCTGFDKVIESTFYGPRFASDAYVSDGIPTLRTTDISDWGKLILQSPPRVNISAAEFKKWGFRDQDLMVTRTGATIGKCALYENRIGNALPSAYLIRIRLKSELMDGRYALLFLLSPAGQTQLLSGRTAVAQPNINARAITSIQIPVPRLELQRQIVHRVDAAFAQLDAVAAEHARAARLLPQLDQAILAQAFRGELVPQDPTDEPASELLARIRAIRADAPKRTHKASPRASSEITSSIMEPPAVAGRGQDMNKTRKDVPANHLCEVVKKSGGKIRADALWHASEMQIDEFYKLLREDIAAKRLKETKDKVSITDAR
jgi:type I restriction enzyme S subunit